MGSCEESRPAGEIWGRVGDLGNLPVNIALTSHNPFCAWYALLDKSWFLVSEWVDVSLRYWHTSFCFCWHLIFDFLSTAPELPRKIPYLAIKQFDSYTFCSFYCGKISLPGKETIYAFNGFFMSMRQKFVEPGTSIYYYVVSWDSAKVKWEEFRSNILGPTDPASAPKDSLRGKILVGSSFRAQTSDSTHIFKMLCCNGWWLLTMRLIPGRCIWVHLKRREKHGEQ